MEGQVAGLSMYLYELGEISVLLARGDGEELCYVCVGALSSVACVFDWWFLGWSKACGHWCRKHF